MEQETIVCPECKREHLVQVRSVCRVMGLIAYPELEIVEPVRCCVGELEIRSVYTNGEHRPQLIVTGARKVA